jgi:hypothetical protein
MNGCLSLRSTSQGARRRWRSPPDPICNLAREKFLQRNAVVAYYQTQLNRLLDRIKDMSLVDLERRTVCGICGARDPLISVKVHDEPVRTPGLHESASNGPS